MTFEERVEAVLQGRVVNHEEAIELAWKRVGESNLARCYLDLCRRASGVLADHLREEADVLDFTKLREVK